MEFTADRDQFAEAVNWAARVVPAKPQPVVLGGIKIRADSYSNVVRLDAYDLETSAQVNLIEPTQLMFSGQALVSGRLLAAITRTLPRKPVTLVKQNTGLEIRCGDARFTLPLMIVEEYPEPPSIPVGSSGVVDVAALREGIERVVPAICRDEALPYLNAINVLVGPESLTLYATDKHRMATASVPWEAGGDVPAGASLLIPARSVGEIGRLAPEGEVTLAFAPDGALLGISNTERRMTMRLLFHSFPDCEKIVPPLSTPTQVTVNVELLAETLNRALLLSNQEFPRVAFDLIEDTDTLTITAADEGLGAFTEDVGVKLTGHQKLSINPRYVLDALSAMPGGDVVMHITDERKPILFRPADADVKYRHVIVPMV